MIYFKKEKLTLIIFKKEHLAKKSLLFLNRGGMTLAHIHKQGLLKVKEMTGFSLDFV